MEIKQMIIDKKYQTGNSLVPKWITIHETDNESSGADALAHARLQARGNDRQASWHYQVDGFNIYQSVPDNVDAWAAGDGARGPGNDTSLHIEICVNKDGDYRKACENAAWLVRYLMGKYSLGIDKVVQHNKWSGKNCPRHLRSGDWGITWNQFLDLVKNTQSASSKNGWLKENDVWYFYANGSKKTGWIKDREIWYFLDANGAMKTGWVKDGNKWYYLNPNGDMRVGWVKDGDKWYFLADNGQMKTGWLKHKNKWYYLKEDGSMAIGRNLINKKWYFLQSDGALLITNQDGEITNG